MKPIGREGRQVRKHTGRDCKQDREYTKKEDRIMKSVHSLEQLKDEGIEKYNLTPILDLSKEYGIVLEGGGAKGAYQIGIWKALADGGIKIKGVAGTSVGALNGALIVDGDLKKAFKIWHEVSYSKIMDVDEEAIAQFFDGNLKVGEVLGKVWEQIKRGGVDITPLKRLIGEFLDEDKIRNSGKDFNLVTFCITEMKALNLGLEDIPYGELEGFLLASAYLYGFKNEKIYGKRYFDGSIVSRLPLNLLLDKGYTDVIEIHLYRGRTYFKSNLPEGVKVYDIVPRVSLGNMMQFDRKRSNINMIIGYYDALRLLYGLEGNLYYIQPTKDKDWFTDRIKKLGSIKKVELELLLRLPLKSDDKEVFMALLEASAKELEVERYHLYTVHTLYEKVKEAYLDWEQKESKTRRKDLPLFVYECCEL
jgi:predicted acylesterase/phospholipase RssA